MANASGLPTGPPKPRLLCIPGAGSSAARFERMRAVVSDLVELRTFELPGRGIRFAEPSFSRLTDHFSHFVDRIEAEPFHRWILLGESLGALSAVSLANELMDSTRAEIVGAITVAAAPGATGRRPHKDVIDQLQTDAKGSPQADRITMAVDTIVADISAAQASADQIRLLPLDVPLATIHGVDDGLIDEASARRWENYADNGWLFQQVSGTHYQFETPSRELRDALRRAISFVLDGHVPE